MLWTEMFNMIRKVWEYGKLSGQNMEELMPAPELVWMNEENPSDFALWKRKRKEKSVGVLLGAKSVPDGILNVRL